MNGLIQLASIKVVRMIAATVVILLIPLVAMQFTDQVAWTVSDFVGMGILLLGFGLLFEGITSVVRDRIGQIAVGATLLVLLLIVWAELAVGLFD